MFTVVFRQSQTSTFHQVVRIWKAKQPPNIEFRASQRRTEPLALWIMIRIVIRKTLSVFFSSQNFTQAFCHHLPERKLINNKKNNLDALCPPIPTNICSHYVAERPNTEKMNSWYLINKWDLFIQICLILVSCLSAGSSALFHSFHAAEGFSIINLGSTVYLSILSAWFVLCL